MLDSVSVVIPTAGRASLTAAVESALAQVSVEVEVLVVVNGDATAYERVAADLGSRRRVRVLQDDSASGANASRQLGIEHASNPVVALLDDDDVWQPQKLLHQRLLIERQELPRWWVVACGVTLVQNGKPNIHAPREFGSGFYDVDRYLFKRTSFHDGRNTLQTSTLLFPRELGLRIPFDSRVKRHQDWDWLLRCQASVGAFFAVAPHYDVDYIVNNDGSLTSSTRLVESVDFARRHLTDRRLLGDFLLTRPLNMAVARGELDSVRHLLVMALRTGRPGIPAMLRAFLVAGRLAAALAVRRRLHRA